MTTDEAKQVFLSRGYVEVEGGTIYDANKWREACYVISERLEQESKIGYWVEEIIKCGRKVFCSECGCSPPFEYVSSGDVYSPSGYGVINKTKFCPNCGARMIDPKEREVENGKN